MSKLPIKTICEGDKITKVCVEDVYKIVNRIVEQMNKSYSKATEIIDSLDKEADDYEGSLIVGTGVSQPCDGDEFNEEIGNNIAFMKAKLNANMKKLKFITKIFKQFQKLENVLGNEANKILKYIELDLDGIRQYNPDYLK